MNAMTCAEVQDQLDLLAADACDPPTRSALEGHLRDCPTCAAIYAESQRLQGLLNLHCNDEGFERLKQRIDQQAPPKRRYFTQFLRRTFVAAALFLIAVGLLWWLPTWNSEKKPAVPDFALFVVARKPIPAPASDKLQSRFKDKAAEMVAVIPLAVRGSKEFRDDLVKAQRDGKLPLPPAVSLDMILVNTSERTVEVRVGDESPTLELELPGDGVVRLAAPQAEEPEFLRPQTLELHSGKQHVFHIDRLIAGSRGKLEYLYVTEPGEYTLTARLRLTAEGKALTVTGAPVRIKVGN